MIELLGRGLCDGERDEVLSDLIEQRLVSLFCLVDVRVGTFP